MTTLANYTTQVQRLLHDLNFQYFQQPELNDYVNEARLRVCKDSKCMRQLLTSYSLTAGQEQYPIANINAQFGITAVDVLGIQIYWGTERWPLDYYSWSDINFLFRRWQTYQQRPSAYSWMGSTTIFILNVPDQNYVSDWDVATYPGDLVNLTDVCPITLGFQSSVKYWAASLASYRKGEIGEAELWKKQYLTEANMNVRSFQTRILQRAGDR